jgi:3'-5' exoribonuclease
MTRRYVKELTNGEAVDQVFLVADKQLRANRQGGLYLHLDLRDKSGVISARLWNATEELARRFDTGDFLATRGKVNLHQGALQLIVSHIETVDPATVEEAEFQARSPLDVSRLTQRLRQHLNSVSDPHLRALGECFLIDDGFLAKFTRAPAGIRNHHAYHAGLLEHTVALLDLSARVAELYPEVDGDLLKMGAFLHDVGKIDELSYDRSFGYTDEGQLIGHLVMGVSILREQIVKSTDLTGEPFPDELRLRLEHMIVSHHGTHEFGSPKLPMTPEAIALHYLDNLDAKLHLFTREIRDDPTREAAWTPFQNSMQRRIFKGRAGRNGDDGGSTGEGD